ncbi:MAG: helix-turn-helix transcriptional regulator [Proteobacteria bacterium]|nr:helix-turn-helix transcriptional regulator [Pseudomonadota bacterium]
MTPSQCKMARSALGWSLRNAADKAGIGINTLVRIEKNADVRVSTIRKLRTAFEAAGIAFLADDGRGCGIRYGLDRD